MLPRTLLAPYRVSRLPSVIRRRPRSHARLRCDFPASQPGLNPVPATNTTTTTTATTDTLAAPFHLYDIRDELVPYQKAWDLQHELVDARRRTPSLPDALILLEHAPVYTLGTASSLHHVLFDADELRRGQTPGAHGSRDDTPMLVRTERGGEVTYHGPGQLVAYPILNLDRHRKDLHWYLRSLEEVVLRVVRERYGLHAARKQGLTGVWVGDQKVCAMGLKVSRWITMHGLALNVCMDVAPFARIVPCGVDTMGVTSLHLLGGTGGMQEARKHLLECFQEVFGPYDIVRTSM